MRHGLLIIFFISFVNTLLFSSSIVVSTDIGFEPSNSTSFLQFAFDETTEDTIIIDNVGSDWMTGPLRLERSNVTIILEEGVVLRALPNAFDIFESLIEVIDRSNIKIIGYGASLIMNLQEYITLADSEFRHGISLNSATNVTLEGLAILDTGGDGVLITRSFRPDSPKNYCENIIIKNCKLSNNYRQGLSITSVKNAQIVNCEFSETSGTLPEDGIDIEPDTPDEKLENILVKGCRIFNNHGNAIQLALLQLDDSSADISITIEDTYMANNHDPSNTFSFAEIAATDNRGNGVDGFVRFNNCFIESSQWTAVYISKTVESYDLIFNNCVFKDVSKAPVAFNNPIFFEVTDYNNTVPRFGGVEFNDCLISYDEEIPFLNVIENSSTSDGLGNVNGNFFVVNPGVVGFETGINPENVNITFEHFDEYPASTVNLSANQIDYLEEERFIVFGVERQNHLEIPVAVSFSYLGNAEYGADYERANGFTILSNNVVSVFDTLEILIDKKDEASEIIELSVVSDSCVIAGEPSMINFSINEIITSVEPVYGLGEFAINIYPNPCTGLVYIETLIDKYDVRIFNEFGHLFKEYRDLSFSILLDVNEIPSGLHFLELKNKVNNSLHVELVLKY